MDVDVEIYCKNLKAFFTNNPNSKEELMSSVPGVTFASFMERVSVVAGKNFKKGGDPSLTRKQLLDTLNDLYLEYVEENHLELSKEVGMVETPPLNEDKIFQTFKGFNIGLN